MIYHIYWGTAGNAGLYLDEIYQVLDKAGYRQKAFVSYYYPFDYGEKVFFRRTEMEHCKYSGITRRLLQAWEVLFAFFSIFFQGIKDKPSVVNYSYVGSGNLLTYWFLKLLKKNSHCKLVITCHDVKPFAKNEEEYEKELAIKRKILDLSDFYLIHNPDSRKDLVELFNVEEGAILEHPFPLMDLSKLSSSSEDSILYDFLFIGHLRREKGIEFLLESWPKYHTRKPEAKLCIAGNPSYYKDYIEERKALCADSNIVLRLGYVKDADYIRLVRQSKCVVFPYIAGTNSGVISTVISLNKMVVVSNIKMFENNPLIPKDSFFDANDKKSFFEVLDYMYSKQEEGTKERIERYRESFNKEVLCVYRTLTN